MLQRLIIPASLSEQNVKVCYIRLAAVETTATSTGTQSSKTPSTMGVCVSRLCPIHLGLPTAGRAPLASSCLILKQIFLELKRKLSLRGRGRGQRWKVEKGLEKKRNAKWSTGCHVWNTVEEVLWNAHCWGSTTVNSEGLYGRLCSCGLSKHPQAGISFSTLSLETKLLQTNGLKNESVLKFCLKTKGLSSESSSISHQPGGAPWINKIISAFKRVLGYQKGFIGAGCNLLLLVRHSRWRWTIMLRLILFYQINERGEKRSETNIVSFSTHNLGFKWF